MEDGKRREITASLRVKRKVVLGARYFLKPRTATDASGEKQM